jgi:hypothetical protein
VRPEKEREREIDVTYTTSIHFEKRNISNALPDVFFFKLKNLIPSPGREMTKERSCVGKRARERGRERPAERKT